MTHGKSAALARDARSLVVREGTDGAVMIDLVSRPWGWTLTRTDARVLVVVVGGQHGDELEGVEGAAVAASALKSAVFGAQNYRASVVFANALCAHGIRVHSRYHDGVDLNRSWPRDHEIVSAVWDEVETVLAQQGLPTVVVDVHATTKDRVGDSRPDTHVFCSSQELSLLPTGWRGVVEPTAGTLEDEARSRLGASAFTVEVARGTDDPGRLVADFVFGVLERWESVS